MTASTSRELDSTPNPGAAQVALSLAVSNATVNAHINVATGATIDAAKTANIISSGNIKSAASAESGIFSDGTAGLAFGLDFSTANISTTVDGTVVARMVPGSVVKIEIDPLVTDEDAIGYVDYARDMIHVGAHALVTEDTITYTNRRGTSIGGLVDSRPYYVVALVDDDTTPDRDESEWIKLAPNEQRAIRASFGPEYHDGNVVDLTLTAVPTPDNNSRPFAGSDVDTEADTITLPWGGVGVFNTFLLGQSVVYHEGSTPIVGLKDGNTYYVVASTSQSTCRATRDSPMRR